MTAVAAARPGSIASVHVASLGSDVLPIGFGCASLGSRVSAAAGLAALDRAFDAGITWFDVAPSYGDGQAEHLLGQFASGKRGRIQIVTKVGLLPPRLGLAKRLVRPALRMLVGAVPSLREAVRRRRPPPARAELTADFIRSSVEASLVRLRTDHVDVVALHDVGPEEAGRAEVIGAMERLVRDGKARAAGIASSPAAIAAGFGATPAYRLAQLANDPFDRGLDVLGGLWANGTRADIVCHSAIGTALRDRVAKAIDRDADIRGAFAQAGYPSPSRDAASAFLADHAFATNPHGIVLFSMFTAEHLAANLARRAMPHDAAAIARLAALLQRRADAP